jgi:ribonuclease P protein component
LFSLPKQLKLNHAAQFRALFRQSKKFSTRTFAIYSFPNQLSHPRLGLVIAKKSVRSAVKRNQIKRIIRESVRLNQQRLGGLDIMVVTYHGIGNLDKAELRELLEREWPKVCKFYQKA